LAIGILLGVLCVVACNAIGPTLRVAAPILLVVLGVLVSLQPVVDVPAFAVPEHLILGGVLPLLLFASAVSMPAANFRRNFSSIVGLSVTLVVITSLALGALFQALLPELGFAGGVAVGAVISPTDAVATSIVKRLGVAPRVVSVLDGEAMLNDASALVILRTALAAVGAAGTSIGGAVGSFGLSVVIATAIGIAVGWASLFVRKRIHSGTVSTLLSFAVPLVAFEPAELAGASGLVAVVAAGLVIGQGAPRYLPAYVRANERINWHTIEMLLEGGLFLVMGLQLVELLRDRTLNIPLAFALAGIALGITLTVRAAYSIPILVGARKQQRRYEKFRERLEDMKASTVTSPEARSQLATHEVKFVDRMHTRARRTLADANYGATSPLGIKDAVLLVWAGMRGAITLAAAQTLPADFPHRSLITLVAFLVATTSLLVQGGTLAWVVRRLKFPPPDEAALEVERLALGAELTKVGEDVMASPDIVEQLGADVAKAMGQRLSDLRLEKLERIGDVMDRVFDAKRAYILKARRDGEFSTEALETALRRVDATQLGMGLTRRGRIGEDH
jgi:CPA1 family monovalent cation:H+ antiporter